MMYQATQRKSTPLQNVDVVSLSFYVGLMLIGWLNIYAASYNTSNPSIFDLSQEYGKQFIWILTSVIIGFSIFLMDGRFITKLSYPFYGISMAMLVLVLLVGKEVNGAKAWFGFGSFGIQPAEFAKVAVNMVMAHFLSTTTLKIDNLKTRVIAVLILLVPAGLIMLQPDTGTVLVFVGFVFVLYRQGLSGNILLFGLLAIVVGVIALLMRVSNFTVPFTDIQINGQYYFMGLVVVMCAAIYLLIRQVVMKRYRTPYYTYLIVGGILSIMLIGSINYVVDNVLSSHQTQRINILLGLEDDPQGAGYNVKQSKTAIGSGGIIGKGYLQGTLTKFKYVPMQSTDFIFCTVGEEWGFVGSFFVVAAFVAFILRILYISERQRSVYTRIYGYGVASILFMHLTINIGMAIGLAPVIGIPLPFFSYGGSSLWAFTILVCIMLKLDAQRLDILR
ncbi:MAG TPA: rod shape-determining protein RodA [Luteibaculaceae bacterium]|nr:rod shape-determining protein RodA [Luteibaculaceae bacterium]